jgi:hypothetical protein
MQQKRKRRVIWRDCRWCSKRNVAVQRFGKLKCLKKHEVKCEAKYRKELGSHPELPSIQVLVEMIHGLQAQVNTLTVEVAMLKERKLRGPLKVVCPWGTMKPSEVWASRKENVKRMIHTCLAKPKLNKYCKTPLEYLSFYLLGEKPTLGEILGLALWPVIEGRGTSGYEAALRGQDTTDIYHIAKTVWGKKYSSCHNLDFYKEAIEECNLDLGRFYDHEHHRELNWQFLKMIELFQKCKKRAGENTTPYGMNNLQRAWKCLTVHDAKFLEDCKNPGLQDS